MEDARAGAFDGLIAEALDRARHRHPQQRVLYRSVGLDCAGAVYGRRLFCVHLVDRNASSTKPAKFLVFLIKNKGAPALVPVQ